MNNKYINKKPKNGQDLKSALMKILQDLDIDIPETGSTPENLLLTEEENKDADKQDKAKKT